MNFDDVWERLCDCTSWRKYGDMADYLGVSAQAVSGAKNRGSFPIEWAFKIAQGHGLSTDWVLTGKGVGGPIPSIDEEFFVRIAFTVETILHQKKIELSLWQKIRLHIYIYENSMLSDGRLDPEVMIKTVALAVTNAALLEEDRRIQKLIEKLVIFGNPSEQTVVRNINSWLKKLIDKFGDTGLLATMAEKEKVISWLEEELKELSTK